MVMSMSMPIFCIDDARGPINQNPRSCASKAPVISFALQTSRIDGSARCARLAPPFCASKAPVISVPVALSTSFYNI
jgi:hypothetical protein